MSIISTKYVGIVIFAYNDATDLIIDTFCCNVEKQEDNIPKGLSWIRKELSLDEVLPEAKKRLSENLDSELNDIDKFCM